MSNRRKRTGVTTPQPWGTWYVAHNNPETVARAQAAYPDVDLSPSPTEQIVRNNRYTVIIDKLAAPEVPGGTIVYLSIKRNDRKPMRNWRDLQRIKNELVGREVEAVELFPAESRMVDCANQYHLWCLSSSEYRFPFGFRERAVGTPEEAAAVGARQEPFDTAYDSNDWTETQLAAAWNPEP